MDTKKLRQKILDLAIHGKLVPQDPTDEPASVLLERIKAEKERLIKEGKIKRSKKSAKTSDTPHYEQVPFEIPDNWVWTTIEEICSKIGSGSTPKGSNYSANGIPFFRSQNVYNDWLVYDDIKYISEEVHKKMKGTEVLANDLLLNITGGSLGRCAVVPADFNCGNVSQHVCIMRSVLVEPEYFHALVLSSYFAKSMKITGSGREGLPKYNLEQMGFPLPPLTEQQRIVTEIEHWFALLDQIEQEKSDLQTIIKQTKSKILDLAIHGKLVPQCPNDEPAIELLKRINPDFTPCDNGHSRKLPQGWAYCQLSNVLRITMGQSPKGDSLNNKRGIEFHQGKICFSDKFLLKSKVYTDEPTKIAVPNSILLCVRAPVGVVNIAKNRICIGRGLCALTPFEGNADFYFYLLQTLQDSFESQSTGTTFKAISGEVIKNEKFALPPLAEQQRIVQKIEELFSSLDNIQTALEV
ncbi:restriction endonuclease subunit S [Alistipes senegalensis]|uniref:Restriction endonuclease subunit S n=2 Tax=Alistipes senegalensis TaxID=1288121 RepID=A0ABY5V644_9BACT|nr:restriction endonuclease subunit S [Alistipes senegalensis]UEA88248.1 restriction endonuclease subunit S [Alistipes senegalensis]UWN64162.1 restriction endonuclease subunit S [Alistipes senegalensis JC50]